MTRLAILTLTPQANGLRPAQINGKHQRSAPREDEDGAATSFEALVKEGAGRPATAKVEEAAPVSAARPFEREHETSGQGPAPAEAAERCGPIMTMLSMAPAAAAARPGPLGDDAPRSKPSIARLAAEPSAMAPAAQAAAPLPGEDIERMCGPGGTRKLLPEPRPEDRPLFADISFVSVESHPLPATRLELPAARAALAMDAPPAPRPMQHLAPEAAPRDAVKHLKIILHPQELGELTLSMRLNGEVLHVAIEAHSGVALAAVRRDETILDRAIKEAGYADAALTISLGPEPPQAADRPQGGPAREQQQHLAGQGFDGNGRERQAHGRAAQSYWRTFDEETEPDATRRGSGPGVFL